MIGLRHCRKKAKMSQRALAKKVGVSSQAVSAWERGESWPSSYYIPAIADALACSIADLYTDYTQQEEIKP